MKAERAAQPCIFLKLRGNAAAAPKRVVLPKTLEGLKKQAQILLKSNKPILSFYEESGEEIFRVEQLRPDMLLMASPAMGRAHATQVKYQIKPLPPRDFAPLNMALPDSDDDDKDVYSDDNDNVDVDDAGSNGMTYVVGRPTLARVAVSPLNIVDNDEEEEEEEEEEHREEENGPEEVMDDDGTGLPDMMDDDGTDFLQSDALESDDDGMHEEEEDVREEAEVDAEETELGRVIAGVLGPQFCFGELNESIENLCGSDTPEWARDYARMIAAEEAESRRVFQKTMGRCPGFQTTAQRQELTMVDALTRRAAEVVAAHRTVEPGVVAHCLRTVIVGPRNSGKSTLMTFIVERLMGSLCLSRTHKQNFVLIFDAKKLAVACSSFKEFFRVLVDMVFDAVADQRSGFAVFVGGVKDHFRELADGTDEMPLPKRFVEHEEFKATARSLAQLGDQFRKCYEEPSAFEEWHTNMLLMPSIIAAAFGFTRVHYIIDHVEYLDVQLSPEHPFVECHEPVNLIEFVKHAISDASYVLACEDLDACAHALTQSDGDQDILKAATFIDVFGMEGDVAGSEMAIMLKFDGDPRRLEFSARDCGGCPAYLCVWEEICREINADKADWNVSVDDYNEQQTTVRNCLQHLLKDVYVVTDRSDDAARLAHADIIEIRPIRAVA